MITAVAWAIIMSILVTSLHRANCFQSISSRKVVGLHRFSLSMLASVLDKKQVDGLLSHLQILNAGSLVQSTQLPFIVDGKILGYIKPSFAELLSSFPDVFVVKNESVSLHSTLESGTCDNRTQNVGKVCLELRNKGVITGWRNELLPVVSSFYDPPALLIERAAYPFFSIKAYGIHVNGYVRDKNGDITHLWVATRSPDKSTYPGMLDHIVAGALPYGISIYDNVVKECEEEANIPESLARKAFAVGAISYTGLDEGQQVKRDTMFCFDLELPPSFAPTPVDGEVQSFELKPLSWVLDKVMTGGPKGFKPNCNLVLIDFFIRHGVISPESRGYLDLVSQLRGKECY